jgi:hypothetical protein
VTDESYGSLHAHVVDRYLQEEGGFVHPSHILGQLVQQDRPDRANWMLNSSLVGQQYKEPSGRIRRMLSKQQAVQLQRVVDRFPSNDRRAKMTGVIARHTADEVFRLEYASTLIVQKNLKKFSKFVTKYLGTEFKVPGSEKPQRYIRRSDADKYLLPVINREFVVYTTDANQQQQVDRGATLLAKQPYIEALLMHTMTDETFDRRLRDAGMGLGRVSEQHKSGGGSGRK